MTEDMGTFRIDIEIENPARPGERRTVTSALLDTGAELSWVPEEILASLGIERYTRGLNYRADPLTKRLVDAGPAPAAVVA